MNDRELHDILSAYLDGEADNPDEVRALLERNPDAFRLYRELSTLSGAVRRLPRAEADGMFAARVMAGVRKADCPAPRRAVWRVAIPAAAMAAAVLVGVFAYRNQPATPAPSADDRLVREISAMSDAELDQLLADLANDLPADDPYGAELPVLLATNTAEAPDAEPSEAMLTYVTELDASYGSAASFNTAGMAPVLDSLNEQEASDLYDALLTYMQEG